jgi:hypothetical protein
MYREKRRQVDDPKAGVRLHKGKGIRFPEYRIRAGQLRQRLEAKQDRTDQEYGNSQSRFVLGGVKITQERRCIFKKNAKKPRP